MSKSLVVIDTPETCSECPLFEIELYRGCRLGGDHWEEKPKWCPLRPLPRRNQGKFFHHDLGENTYVCGWNACLDEITGEAE